MKQMNLYSFKKSVNCVSSQRKSVDPKMKQVSVNHKYKKSIFFFCSNIYIAVITLICLYDLYQRSYISIYVCIYSKLDLLLFLTVPLSFVILLIAVERWLLTVTRFTLKYHKKYRATISQIVWHKKRIRQQIQRRIRMWTFYYVNSQRTV